MIQINILGHTKLELNFGKVETVDIHEETRVIKKNDMKAGENSSFIVWNSDNLWYVIRYYVEWSEKELIISLVLVG